MSAKLVSLNTMAAPPKAPSGKHRSPVGVNLAGDEPSDRNKGGAMVKDAEKNT
jgi:hypothetical protein